MWICGPLWKRPQNPHFPFSWPVWAQWADLAYYWLPLFLLIFWDQSRPSQCNTLPPRAKMWIVGPPRSVQRTYIYLNVTSVGPEDRLGIQFAFAIFCGFLRPFTTLSVHYPPPSSKCEYLGCYRSVQRTHIYLKVTCVGIIGRVAYHWLPYLC